MCLSTHHKTSISKDCHYTLCHKTDILLISIPMTSHLHPHDGDDDDGSGNGVVVVAYDDSIIYLLHYF